jgi:hypothetical protein
MTIKDLLKSVEGLVVIIAFGLTILTGAKLFAWLGAIGYVIVNLPNGIETIKSLYTKIVSYFKEDKI